MLCFKNLAFRLDIRAICNKRREGAVAFGEGINPERVWQASSILHLNHGGNRYVSFDRYQSELLFKVVADRSERGSIIVTTNLPFSEWTSLLYISDNKTSSHARIDHPSRENRSPSTEE